jgi:hypothetical protein
VTFDAERQSAQAVELTRRFRFLDRLRNSDYCAVALLDVGQDGV